MAGFLVSSENTVDQAPVAFGVILCKNKITISQLFEYNIACLPPLSNRLR